VADVQISPTTPAPAGAPSSSSPSPAPPATVASPPASGSPSATPSSPPSASPAAPPAPSRPEWLPEAHWSAETASIKPDFGQHYKDLIAFQAAETSRNLTLPQKVEDYEAKLPADFKAPEGVEYQVDPNNPGLPLARQFALEAGLSKDQFSKLLALDAGMKIAEMQRMNTIAAGEVEKLGAAGGARVDAVTTWWNAMTGDETFGKILKQFPTASFVNSVEKLMTRFRAQGVAAPNAGAREAPAPNSPSDTDWEKMSHAARKEYAAQFDQTRFNGSAR
jgi:hypothetical protein